MTCWMGGSQHDSKLDSDATPPAEDSDATPPAEDWPPARRMC